LEASAEEALAGIRSLIKDIVADMESNGEPIPEPLATKKFSGKFQVRITPEAHRMLAMQAAENGVSLNRYISSKLAG
jgi:predicted HicB family RNase H-like nuclease